MPDDSSRRAAEGLAEVQDDLDNQGYALTSGTSIGLPSGFRESFSLRYYTSDTLRHDPGDFPLDRERARDVIRYWRSGEALDLKPFDRITLTDRADIPGQREHSRVQLLKDPEAEMLIRAFLRLIPSKRWQADGTFGVNLFRIYTNVVTTPNHDDEEFVILYIIDRIGDGGETYLYNPEDVTDNGEILAEPVLRQRLNPDDILIIEDKVFKHGLTPLISPPGGTARRDALVCTVDYRTTYLAPAASD